MQQEIIPEVLIISSKYDYSTDYISCLLSEKSISYLRINRDQFSEFNLSMSPTKQEILGANKEISFTINPKYLKSIYFRAPIFLRDIYKPKLTPDEQFSRSQWSAFVRSFLIFDNVFWINNPQSTYKAEVKPYQLFLANKIGFKTPKTRITNYISNDSDNDKMCAIKTLESVILNIDSKDAFIYTNIVPKEEILNEITKSAPFILQDALVPKIDIRVTIIGNHIFAAEIKLNGKGIDRDWRLEKNNVEYNEIKLPNDVELKCIELVRKLDLVYGAIDLVYFSNDYYFIEINPTGEWGWLLDEANFNIDRVMVDHLIRGQV